MNVFGTNLAAALGDVAVTDPMNISELVGSILRIQRMHLQRRSVDQKPRPDKAVVHAMIAQDVADILAKKALDAFPEFLDSIDIGLLHPPGAIRRIRWARFEFLDPLLHRKIPRHIGDQVFQDRECLDRLDRNWSIDGQLAHSGHAHQPGHAVDFSRTRPALASLTIPPAGQIRSLSALNVVNRVQHNHALGDVGGVITKCTIFGSAAPNSEIHCRCRGHFIA